MPATKTKRSTAAVSAKVKSPKVKSGKVTKRVQKTSEHPPYSVMIQDAIKALDNRKGTSKAAILKHVMQNYEVGDNGKRINAHLCLSLNRGADSGLFKRVKGVGAAGMFRLGEEAIDNKKITRKSIADSPKSVTKKTAANKKVSKPKAEKAKMEKKAKTVKPKSPKVNKSHKAKAVARKRMPAATA